METRRLTSLMFLYSRSLFLSRNPGSRRPRQRACQSRCYVCGDTSNSSCNDKCKHCVYTVCFFVFAPSSLLLIRHLYLCYPQCSRYCISLSVCCVSDGLSTTQSVSLCMLCVMVSPIHYTVGISLYVVFDGYSHPQTVGIPLCVVSDSLSYPGRSRYLSVCCV